MVAQYFGQPPGALAPPPIALGRRGSQLPWPEAVRIVAETVVPSFPSATFAITDPRYGATGDRVTDNTTAIRRTVEDCSSRGGGHVVVPAGVYSTGAIHLKSNVDLHLEENAVLRFNGSVDNYPLVLTRYEGIECVNHSPMVYAYGQTNLALTGSGTLDASGTRLWNSGSNRAAILEPLVAAGVLPHQRIVPEHGRLRSSFIEPYGCNGVLIQGVTLRQSQFWQLHPTMCRNVTVDAVTTGSAANPNTDGCNPESCDHVVIKNCTLEANDDCIGIKAGRDEDGRRLNIPSQNIVIFGCKLQGPAGGIACGSEMTGGIRNVYAYDIQTYGQSVRYMLYVKSNTRRGGYAENLHFDSIQADHVLGAWGFAQMDYDGQNGTHRPSFKNWSISRAIGDSDPEVFRLSGLADDPIRGFDARDSRFTHTLIPINLYSNLTDITFDNVTINGRLISS
jgi:polygalacturonase